ncbi:MAG TPA: class I SAM-dependent methyltransferase [Chthonomonadaceae bacterium]|nr:class I SAM-dependent methyltransferase [Chthonomonadaceae bacterium]
MSVKATIPWWMKIGAKVTLSRIPVGYRFWQKLALFQHGHMEQPSYAYEVFRSHYDRAAFGNKDQGFVGMELGPGDTLFSALIARAFGAATTYLVDVGPFARQDQAPYLAMAAYLAEHHQPLTDLSGAHSLAEILALCGAKYETRGLDSLRALPDASVDFIWSQAVFEHIRQGDFDETMRQLRRILRPDGVASHQVDLRDHLGGALNNLRFSDQAWESDFMARSGFYTNRIRFREMLSAFERAGFQVEVVQTDVWERVPTPPRKMAPRFRDLTEDDLRVLGFAVLLRPIP